jgi:hypothetical protein
MGLIGSYLGVIYCGGSGFYMSPFAFIKDPLIWIRAISKFKATHVQAPNFAFSLTVKRYLASSSFEGGDKVDLSSLKHMYKQKHFNFSVHEKYYAAF